VAAGTLGLVWGDGMGEYDEADGISTMCGGRDQFTCEQEAGVEGVVTVARAGVCFGAGGAAAED
jgi:hypothetical protein